ncbi:MAG: TolC family protein, partial [Myxococcales bacterium]
MPAHTRSRVIGVVLLLLPLSTTASARAQALSPERAVAVAASRNPGLKASIADLQAARHTLAAQQAARGPVLVASATGQRNENMVATGQGVTRTEGRNLGSDVALRYTTDIGTTLEAGASGNVSWRSANITPNVASTVSLGPNPSVALRVSARQPLLRGGGRDVVLAGLREAMAGRTEAERSRDEAASALVRDVLVAYWELWYAQRAVQVQDAALELARAQHRDARVRAEQLGTAPRTEVLRFASELASISESRAQARETAQARALELGRMLALSPTNPPAPFEGIEPPVDDSLPPLPTLLEHARSACSELRALSANVQAARERVRAAADDDQARLDVTTTLSAA